MATAVGRPLEDGEQRHHLRARLRRPGRSPAIGDVAVAPSDPTSSTSAPASRTTASPRRGATASTSRRRRQDLDPPGSRRHPAHRPRRRPPHEPGRRLRRGPRPPLGTEQGARPLQDDRRRQDLDEHQVHRRGHGLRGRGDGSREPATRCTPPPTSGAARPFGYNGGGPGQRALEDDGRRRHLDEAHRAACPREGDVGRIGDRRLPPRSAHRVRAGRAREGRAGSTARRTRARPGSKMSDTNPRPVVLQPGPRRSRQRPAHLGRWARPCTTPRTAGRPSAGPRSRRSTATTTRCGSIPPNSEHMILAGSDGGDPRHLRPRREPGTTSTPCPSAQFYEVTFDMRSALPGLRRPAGQRQLVRAQPNPVPAGHRATRTGSASAAATASTPSIDPDRSRRRLRGEPGRQRGPLRPAHQRAARHPSRGRPTGERYRFNWNSPILISPHDSQDDLLRRQPRLRLHATAGETWAVVGPDLTNGAERDEMTIFGKSAKEFLSRNDGVVHFGTITTWPSRPSRPESCGSAPTTATSRCRATAAPPGRTSPRRRPGRAQGHLRQPGGAEPRRRGRRLRRLRRPPRRRLQRLPLPHRRLRPDLAQSVAAGPAHGPGTHVGARAPGEPDLLFAGTERGLLDEPGTAGGQLARGAGQAARRCPWTTSRSTRATTTSSWRTHGRGVYILDDAGPPGPGRPATARSTRGLPASSNVGAGHRVPRLRPQGQHGTQDVPGRPNPPDGAPCSPTS